VNERPADDADAIISAFHTIHLALNAATVGSWLDLDLSMAQLKTLFVIARSGPASIGQVAETLRVGLPTASHLTDRLVQEGLVCRSVDSEDRRRTLADLTPEGQQLVARLRQGSVAQLRTWIEELDEHQRSSLLYGLRAMAAVAEAAVEAQDEGNKAQSDD